MTLAAVILTRNEKKHIAECIASVTWADRVVVFDSGSTDGTQEIARQAGAEVLENAFQNYAQQRNDALNAVEADWILFVDADERVTSELQAEVEDIIQNPAHSGYWIPRHNYIFGKLTRHTGWYPDYQMRLLKRGEARYDMNRPVHELVILKSGEAGYIKAPFLHYNYDNVVQFHEKQHRYVAYDAQMLFEEGIRPKVYTPYLQPFRHFKWRFLDLGGYKDGLHGLRLSLLMAWYEHRKYKLLREKITARL
jgi:(heptosyl)LPS beta-1,4-glucosyltransferase